MFTGKTRFKWDESSFVRTLDNWTDYSVAVSKETVVIIGGIATCTGNRGKSNKVVLAHNYLRPKKCEQ